MISYAISVWVLTIAVSFPSNPHPVQYKLFYDDLATCLSKKKEHVGEYVSQGYKVDWATCLPERNLKEAMFVRGKR